MMMHILWNGTLHNPLIPQAFHQIKILNLRPSSKID